MVMEKADLESVIRADEILRKAGGSGIDQAGYHVQGGQLYYNDELVLAKVARAIKLVAVPDGER